MDPDDPRVIALAAAIREIAPAFPPADANAHAHARAYAHGYVHDYAYARARARAYARDYACIPPPLTDEQQAQIDAAHALLFG